MLRSSRPVAGAVRSLDITHWRAADRFVGEPQTRRWLIEGVFPQAQAALIAVAGGVGKSFLLLALAREVAAFDGIWVNAPTLFGGAVPLFAPDPSTRGPATTTAWTDLER